MAFLQWSDVVFQYSFPAPGTALGAGNMVMYAEGPSVTSAFGVIQLRTAVDVNAQFKNANRGYRDSYGRYYDVAADTDHMWTTFGIAGQRGVWEKLSFTYGLVFRWDGSGAGHIMSKPSTASGPVNTVGNELLISSAGNLSWQCSSDTSAVRDTAGISGLTTDAWYIGSVVKADGVVSKIGVKKKGAASWQTAVSSASVTPDYDNAKDAAIGGRINLTNNAKEAPWPGDIQKFCMWDVAITEATVQSDLEDHFGQIGRPAAPMTLGGGMGGMQGLGRRKGRGYG